MKYYIYLIIYFISGTLSVNAQFKKPTVISHDSSAYTSSFIALWAGDTAVIETYTIRANHLFGRAIHLYPEPHLRQFHFYYHDDGSLRDMSMQLFDLKNTSVPLETKSLLLPYLYKMDYYNEVVDFRTLDKNGEKQWVHAVSRMDFMGGWIPILGQWQWLTNLVYKGSLENNLKFINVVIKDYDLEVTKKSNSELIFKSDISAPIKFFTDSKGKIDSINALGSPWNFKIYKTKPLDVEKFTKKFAEKKIIGDPSPREYSQATIDKAKVTISYGSPSKRGRKIFGEVVPWNQVWRTGAGATTQFTTNKNLIFNGKLIPKGTYNLYTIPQKSQLILIFNTEKEAWGSAYISEYDYAKIPMKVQFIDPLVEKFTIDITSTDKGGELIIKWDHYQAAIDFIVAQ